MLAHPDRWETYSIDALREARDIVLRVYEMCTLADAKTEQWAFNTWRALNTAIAIRVEREGDYLRWSRSPEYEVWETWHLNQLDA